MQCAAIDVHGNLDGAINSSDFLAAFLGGIDESAYGHWGSGKYIAGYL